MKLKSLTILCMSICINMYYAVAQCSVTFSTSQPYPLTVAVTGSAPHAGIYTYIWDWGDGTIPTTSLNSNAAQHTYSTSGNYNICVTYFDISCLTEDVCQTVNVASPPPNLCGLNLTYSHTGTNWTVNATGSGATDPYLVFVPDILAPLSFQFQFANSYSFNHTYPTNNSYIFCVEYGDNDTVAPPCEANFYCFTVNPTLSIDNENIYIVSYPNPTTDYVNISFTNLATDHEVAQFSIYDISGKIRKEENTVSSNNTYTLYTGDLQPGVYFVYMKIGSQIYRRSIIKA